MSRGLEIDDGRDDERRVATASFEGPAARSPRVGDRPRDPHVRSATLPQRHFTLPRGPARETVRGRHRSYRLRGSESQILTAAGIFRVVFERDLEETVYRDDSPRLGQDVRHLMRQGLLERRTLVADHRGPALAVLNLTRDGHALLERRRAMAEGDRRDGAQTVVSGWRKVSEVVHDASLFRMYQVEAARIEAGGWPVANGTPERSVRRGGQHAAPCEGASGLDP